MDEQVAALEEINESINEAIKSGNSVALAEIVKAHPECMNGVLDNRGDIRYYRNPLYVAVEAQNEQGVRYLLSRGVEIIGTGALHTALRSNYLNIAQAVLDFGADINEVAPGCQSHEKGNTPLVSAIEGGHIEAVQWAIDHGADIAKTTEEAWEGTNCCRGVKKIAPLHAAIRRRNIDIVKLLLSLGADIHQEASGWKKRWDYSGETGTAIHFAVGYGTKEICELILGQVPDEEIQSKEYDHRAVIVWAAEERNYDGLIYLLHRGVALLYHPSNCNDWDDFTKYLVKRYEEAKGQLDEKYQKYVDDLLHE